MRKIILLSVVFSFLLTFSAYAGGVVLDSGGGVYTSILHKTFSRDKYRGENVERWILLQTNIPDFVLNSAKKEAKKKKVRFTEEFQNKYILNIHEKLISSFYKGWLLYFLAKNNEAIFRNSINLGNKIYVYKKQPKSHGCKVVPIVDYSFDIRPDIEINFLDTGKLSFWVTIPEVDSSPSYNKFKYRGEGLEKFFKKVVFRKYEESLRNNYHYK